MLRSLSARRAWIEIANFCKNRFCPTVALRKESVDRNARKIRPVAPDISSLSARRAWIEIRLADMSAAWHRSLSARRAWIEIDWASVISAMTSVALRKESVDRNDKIRAAILAPPGSLSARRAWIEIERLFIPSHWIICRSPQGERG